MPSHESSSTPHNLHLPSPMEEESTENLSHLFSTATVLPCIPTPPSPTPVAQRGILFPSLPFHPPPPPPAPIPPAMSVSKSTELHLNMPKAYDGSPAVAKYWLNSVRTYLHINKDVYSSNDKRIGYALSFMIEGTAKSWAAICTQEALDNNLWSLCQLFVSKFQKTFLNTNSIAEATTWLTNT